jgi:hypothetical protein
MSGHIILIEPRLAQTEAPAPTAQCGGGQLWMIASGVLLLALIGVGVFYDFKLKKVKKEKRFEEFKNRELQNKLKLSLNTISKMEKNPDLIHSREFNLDYLRMRMEEEQFQFAIVNQIKIKVKEKITVALRPHQAEQGALGIASSSARQIDEIFDIVYDPSGNGQATPRVLFRIQIKLAKLPTQPTSTTIHQVIDCMTKFMSQDAEGDNWQPTIQGRIAYMHWDQKAKPTPLLVLEQTTEGVNVTFRTSRMN